MNFSSACCCNGCFCPLMCPAVIRTDQTAWNIDLHKYFMSALLLKVGEASPFLFYSHRGWNFNNCRCLTCRAVFFKIDISSFLFLQDTKNFNNRFQRSNLKVFHPITARMANTGIQLIWCYFVVKGAAVSTTQNVAAWASSYLQRKHFSRSSSDSYEKPPLVHYA